MGNSDNMEGQTIVHSSWIESINKRSDFINNSIGLYSSIHLRQERKQQALDDRQRQASSLEGIEFREGISLERLGLRREKSTLKSPTKSESDREGGKYMTLTTFLKDGDRSNIRLGEAIYTSFVVTIWWFRRFNRGRKHNIYFMLNLLISELKTTALLLCSKPWTLAYIIEMSLIKESSTFIEEEEVEASMITLVDEVGRVGEGTELDCKLSICTEELDNDSEEEVMDLRLLTDVSVESETEEEGEKFGGRAERSN
ncbi:hypothetical protein H8356DRAFT_1346437 [Neocallimastix lanati (nom. inval.)]|nr:hypothetical protein H8356DRAFT_1346437 [Neocallimastix sp. JGI-2020a]